MEASLYATQWFLSLFCSDISTDIALEIIDFFLVYDVKVIFKVTLALLKQVEENALRLRCDDILVLLKRLIKELPIDEVAFSYYNSINCSMVLLSSELQEMN